MDTKFLEEIGLTPKEANVYIALLGVRSASIFEVMNKAHVSRQRIYELLQSLLEKGLISFTIRDNKKQFTAISPERLIEIEKERETNLRSILPELLNKYNENKEDTQMEMFLGKEGMKTLLGISQKVGAPVYILSGEGEIFETLKYFMPNFFEKRAEKGIPTKMVYCETARKTKLKLPLTEIRYVPNEYYSPISIAIYGNNVNFIVYSENPLGIHIQSKEIAQSFMNYFNLMWSLARK